MTIADFLIKNVRAGNLSTSHPGLVQGMGETWKFYPDKFYQPGYIKNVSTGSIMGTVELYDREADSSWLT